MKCSLLLCKYPPKIVAKLVNFTTRILTLKLRIWEISALCPWWPIHVIEIKYSFFIVSNTLPKDFSWIYRSKSFLVALENSAWKLCKICHIYHTIPNLKLTMLGNFCHMPMVTDPSIGNQELFSSCAKHPPKGRLVNLWEMSNSCCLEKITPLMIKIKPILPRESLPYLNEIRTRSS